MTCYKLIGYISEFQTSVQIGATEVATFDILHVY